MNTLSEDELEREVSDAISRIDESEAASSRVSRQTSADFYRRVASECNDRATTIESEMSEDSAYESPADLQDEDSEEDEA